MLLINCQVSLFPTWSSTCVITNFTGEGRSKTTDTKRFVPVVTLSIQNNVKLLQQLKSGFRRTINWNKYQSDPKTYAKNRYLNHLVYPSYHGVNRYFVISFENVMMDGKNLMINQKIANLKHMKILEKLVSQMIRQAGVYQTILTLKIITK